MHEGRAREGRARVPEVADVIAGDEPRVHFEPTPVDAIAVK